MVANVTRPLLRSTSFFAFLGRGVRSPYIHPFTARGDSSKSSAAFSTPRERMNEGKSMAMRHIPRIAEFWQVPHAISFPRIGQPLKIHGFTLSPMDYKNEIGRRIRKAREENDWTLAELAIETGDLLTLKRINAYENGDRMPGPAEAVILAQALGIRAAYLMAVDDVQLPITPQEESLVRNWRTLNERDRMDMYRKIETMSLQNRDPYHQPTPTPIPPPQSNPGTRLAKAAVHKRVRKPG